MVEANPLLFKVVAQVQKEWTSSGHSTNASDVQLSPGRASLIVIAMMEYLWMFSFSCLFLEW